MSGRQAKAIRKSAKKAAAEKSAPAPSGARLEEFIIGNVRCFAGEQRVPIRPITLLVGENSTGKTTFLGCLHEVNARIFPAPKNLMGGELGFNTSSFHMGGFRDIARRGGNSRVVREFNAGVKRFAYVPKLGDVSFSVMFFFREEKIKASAAKMSFSFATGEPSVKFTIAKGKANGEFFLSIGAEKSTGRGDTIIQSPMLENSPMTLRLPSLLFMAASAGEIANKDFTEAAARIARISREALSGGKLKGESITQDVAHVFAQIALTVQKFSSPRAATFVPKGGDPRRTYNALNGDTEAAIGDGDAHALIFRMSREEPEKWGELRKRLVAFGKESGMFSDFNVMGHGSRAGGDFHLEVEAQGVKCNIADVGHGVSQIYPVLTSVMSATQRRKPATFLLQEPEVHLHPQAQAALASFLAKSAKEDGHAFIIETHGDGIIDRVRVCVKRGDIAPEDVVLLYFEPDKKTGAVKIHPIHVDKLGNVLGAPVGYRRFFLDETDRLLGFKK